MPITTTASARMSTCEGAELATSTGGCDIVLAVTAAPGPPCEGATIHLSVAEALSLGAMLTAAAHAQADAERQRREHDALHSDD